MNIKQFHMKYLWALIHPEAFFLPYKKKQPSGEEMIFEITTTSTNESVRVPYIFYTDYVINANTTWSYLVDKTAAAMPGLYAVINGTSISWRNVSDDFYIILEATDSNGNNVTKSTHPEYFVDWPYNCIENNQISENMVMRNFGFSIDWGDGNITKVTKDDIYTYTRTLTNGLTIKYYSGSLKDYNITYHTYETPGVYTVKVTGNTPCFAIPKQCTRFIQWGNIGLRTLSYMFKACEKLSSLNAVPGKDSLSHVYACCYLLHSNIKSYSPSFLNSADNIVLCNYTFPVCNSSIPDDFMFGKKYLSQCYQMFAENSYSNKGDVPIHIGDNFMKDCPSLKEASYIFRDSPIESIGNNFMAGCRNLISIYYGFYGCSYKSIWDSITGNAALKYIGSNFLDGDTNLVNIEYLFYGCQNLRTIGANIFRDCKNIRCANYLFYNMIFLHKIPDKLFYYIENDPEYSVDIFRFNYAFYKYYVSSPSSYTWETKDPFITEIGSNMFSSKFFSSGLKIYIDSTGIFTTGWSAYAGDSLPIYYNRYIYFNPYSGNYPDLWNHPGSVFIKNSRLASEYCSVTDIINGNFTTPNNYLPNFNLALFGMDVGDYSHIGYTHSETLAANFDQIPKPVGYPNGYINSLPLEEKKKTAADAIWLQPLLSSYVQPARIRKLEAPKAVAMNYQYLNLSSVDYSGFICCDGLVYNYGATAAIPWVRYDQCSISYLVNGGFSDKQWHTVSGISMIYLRASSNYILDTDMIPGMGWVYANFDGPSTPVSSGGLYSFTYFSFRVTETETYIDEYIESNLDRPNSITYISGDDVITVEDIPILSDINFSTSYNYIIGYSGEGNQNGSASFTSVRQSLQSTIPGGVENKSFEKTGNAMEPEIGALSRYFIHDQYGVFRYGFNESGNSEKSRRWIYGEHMSSNESPYYPASGTLTNTGRLMSANWAGSYNFEQSYIHNGYYDAIYVMQTPNASIITSQYGVTFSVDASGFYNMVLTASNQASLSMHDFLKEWSISHYGESDVLETGSSSSLSYPTRISETSPVLNVFHFDDHIEPQASLRPYSSKWLSGLKVTNGMTIEEFNAQNSQEGV